MALRPNALTTLAVAKSHLSIKADDVSQDVRVELFINAASERIERFCNRKLRDQGAITEYQHGRRSNVILMSEYPILTITSLRIDDEGLFTDPSTLIDPSDYFIADGGNTIYYSKYFPDGYNNIKIVYTAGYSSTAIPSDLELACLWLVEWYYLHRTRGDMGRTTSSKGDESVGVLAAMPPMVADILIDYKRSEFQASNAGMRNL